MGEPEWRAMVNRGIAGLQAVQEGREMTLREMVEVVLRAALGVSAGYVRATRERDDEQA